MMLAAVMVSVTAATSAATGHGRPRPLSPGIVAAGASTERNKPWRGLGRIRVEVPAAELDEGFIALPAFYAPP
jgi:hypothetical protein